MGRNALVVTQVLLPPLSHAIPPPIVIRYNDKLLPPRVPPSAHHDQALLGDPPDKALGRSRGARRRALREGQAANETLVPGRKGGGGERVHVREDARQEGNLAEDPPFPAPVTVPGARENRARGGRLVGGLPGRLLGVRDVKDVEGGLVRRAGEHGA